MTLSEAVLLGVIQGLTEFLPVSSSGHLVFLQNVLGLHEPMIAFDVMVHCGTLVAILLYFWRDILQIIRDTIIFLARFFAVHDRRILLQQYPFAGIACLIIVAFIPTAVIGLLFRDTFEKLFGSVMAVGIAWLIMGFLLATSWAFQNGTKKLLNMGYFGALFIGFAQGSGIIPGISRSGITILAGMILGLERKDAVRFSFWIAIPAILGAGLLEFGNGVNFLKVNPVVLCYGFMSAAFVGLFAIAVLMRLVHKGKFFVFGFYCFVLGFLALLYHFGFQSPSQI